MLQYNTPKISLQECVCVCECVATSVAMRARKQIGRACLWEYMKFACVIVTAIVLLVKWPISLNTLQNVISSESFAKIRTPYYCIEFDFDLLLFSLFWGVFYFLSQFQVCVSKKWNTFSRKPISIWTLSFESIFGEQRPKYMSVCRINLNLLSFLFDILNKHHYTHT